MSVTVSVMSTDDLPEGLVLARYAPERDTLWIYPAGLGRGSVLVMSKSDWGRISREVMLAMSRAENPELFIAVEGNGDAL